MFFNYFENIFHLFLVAGVGIEPHLILAYETSEFARTLSRNSLITYLVTLYANY